MGLRDKVIAVDFDGVIHKYSRGWNGGKIYDPPIEGAKEAIEKLLSEGFDVVIFTVREDLKAIEEYLQENGFPPLVATNRKPAAIA